MNDLGDISSAITIIRDDPKLLTDLRIMTVLIYFGYSVVSRYLRISFMLHILVLFGRLIKEFT